MLQFILNFSEKWDAAQQARMAISGGCRWIHIGASAIERYPDIRKTLANEIIPICRDNEAFLTIENQISMVEDLNVHGVVLADSRRDAVAAVRERLGAEAIIGVVATSANEIIALKGLDVDYAIITAHKPLANPSEMLSYFDNIVEKALHSDVGIHLVAECNESLDVLKHLVESGYSGVAVSTLITNADNPESEITAILAALQLPEN